MRDKKSLIDEHTFRNGIPDEDTVPIDPTVKRSFIGPDVLPQ